MRRTKFRALGGPRVYKEAIRGSQNGNSRLSVAPLIEHIVLRTKKKPEMVLQPESIELEPVVWSNLLGGEVESKWGHGDL